MINRITASEFVRVYRYISDLANRERRPPLAIAAADEAANLVFLAHMEGAHFRSGQMAGVKAMTAAKMGKTTAALHQICRENEITLDDYACGGLTLMPGGSPIFDAEGTLIGGIGISGWPVVEDQSVADRCCKIISDMRSAPIEEKN